MNILSLLMGAFSAAGMRVIEDERLDPQPKLKLSPDCPVSDEFRAEMDAWLLERFGTDIGEVATFHPLGVAVAPSLSGALREAIHG